MGAWEAGIVLTLSFAPMLLVVFAFKPLRASLLVRLIMFSLGLALGGVAVFGSLFLESDANPAWAAVDDRWLSIGFLAPVIEEILKGVAVAVALVALRVARWEVNGATGAHVGAMVGAAFAFMEGALFSASAWDGAGPTAGLFVGVTRTLGVGVHVLGTGLVGYWLASRKLLRAPRGVLWPVAAVLWHVANNTTAYWSEAGISWVHWFNPNVWGLLPLLYFAFSNAKFGRPNVTPGEWRRFLVASRSQVDTAK